MTHFKAPFKSKKGLPWDVEAEIDFASPALCGARDWDAATDKPDGVTCPECARLLREEPIKLFTKLAALPGAPNPCGCCPPIEPFFALERGIFCFGDARLTCDGATVWDFDNGEPSDAIDGHEAERLALEKPNGDWRIVLYGPLHGETYQRHGPGRWVLVEKNEGFA